LGYRVHGTVGLIVRSVRGRQKTPAEVVKILEAVPRHSTLHIRRALLGEVIAAVKAEFGLP
ncbi:MAG: hypothetical protein IH608_05405, partial [Proteobacteria bacterium]|nr:hypothetical protein [Pseudomonadota bacterium]